MDSMAAARFNHTEIKILTLLDKGALHVRALRRELKDNGAVSTHLKHLQELGLVKREKRKGRVVNTLTSKGRQVAKALKILKL
jgi:DNA-binding HxlR family transcriptional regulator